MLYDKMRLSNPELAGKTHSDEGYKFYTFSNLKLHNRDSLKKSSQKGLDYDTAEFILSSPNETFIKSFVEGLLINPEFYLEGISGKKIPHDIQEIKMLPMEKIENMAHFRALSPVYVKTFRNIEGKMKNIDLSPSDPKFYENIQKNIIFKYNEYYNEKIEEPHFEIYDIYNIKLKRIKIADTFRRCSFLSFKVQAPQKILQFMYDSGVGEKNAMGFGCLDLIK